MQTFCGQRKIVRGSQNTTQLFYTVVQIFLSIPNHAAKQLAYIFYLTMIQLVMENPGIAIADSIFSSRAEKSAILLCSDA